MYLPIFLVFVGGAFAGVQRSSCDIKSQNFNQCLKDYVQKYIPLVALEGIPERGIQRLDPFDVFGLSFDFNSNLIRGKLEVRKASLFGLRHTKVTDLNVNVDDPNKVLIDAEGFIPKLLLEGVYKANGRLPGMQVKGEGSFKVLLEEMSGNVKVEAEVMPIEGKTYLNVKFVDISPKVNNMKILVDGLMPDDPKLAETAVRMMNDMWRDFYNEMLPIFKPTLNEIIKTHANLFSAKIAVEDIIPA